MTQQPPANDKPGKADEQTKISPAKQDKELTGIDKPGKETAKQEQPPVETQPAPEVPVQLPPGAKIAVPGGAAPAPGKFEIGSILAPALWLIGILAVGAILIAWLRKNKERQSSPFSVSPHEQLTAFRDSMEEGDMTEEEFKKVKAHLAGQIKQVPAAPPPVEATQAKQTPPPANNGTPT